MTRHGTDYDGKDIPDDIRRLDRTLSPLPAEHRSELWRGVALELAQKLSQKEHKLDPRTPWEPDAEKRRS